MRTINKMKLNINPNFYENFNMAFTQYLERKKQSENLTPKYYESNDEEEHIINLDFNLKDYVTIKDFNHFFINYSDNLVVWVFYNSYDNFTTYEFESEEDDIDLGSFRILSKLNGYTFIFTLDIKEIIWKSM